ncbi:class I SAM-dependent methyltransferase [Nitrosopumilus sp.]|uniref:class I SAM-dependent methyltransferase n=1 Tax=Nitrosopumilus sp. TaxID=2024843 RepID=UPI002633B51A|nr:class I SAM-dependent methyltransferase [Nitrosopumilus sp.]
MNDDAKNFKETFPGWDDYYKDNDVKSMPWYEEKLDHDLENELNTRSLNSGNFLDLGTGPGTQAIQLSNYGFDVTGTDISNSAIERAKKLSDKIDFLVDDILDSKFPDKKFDYIFDRGVFHVFEKDQRAQYLSQIKRILNENGILFLKCMSKEEKNLPDDGMPHKFSKQDIEDFFNSDFEIQKISTSIFKGTLDEFPKALFSVLKKK